MVPFTDVVKPGGGGLVVYFLMNLLKRYEVGRGQETQLVKYFSQSAGIQLCVWSKVSKKLPNFAQKMAALDL